VDSSRRMTRNSRKEPASPAWSVLHMLIGRPLVHVFFLVCPRLRSGVVYVIPKDEECADRAYREHGSSVWEARFLRTRCEQGNQISNGRDWFSRA